jgi:type IX secretion system PorP/SprF family membrane protein
MRNKIALKVICCVILFSKIGYAQDARWSQFYDNPILLNPSLAGEFKGTTRFHLNYRDQWRSVTKPFQTFSFTVDSKFSKHKSFRLGWSMLHDQVGDGKFKTLEINVNPSYEKILNRDTTDRILVGANLGFNHRNYIMDNFQFDEQFNGINFDPSAPITEEYTTLKKTNLTLGIGTAYNHRINRKMNIQTGLSIFNLNQPNQGFYGEKVKRDVRITYFARLDWKIKEKVTIYPQLLYQRQGTLQEFVLGVQGKLKLIESEKEQRSVYAGLFYRTADAVFLNLGIDYNAWYVGVSYDVNVSTLKPASAGRGGFELVTKYVINRFKPKQQIHRVCPEFI